MKVFISYKRNEFYCAEYLTLRLREKGYDVWFDVERLQQNMDWQTEIGTAIDTADALVLIMSQASLKSPHVAVEWEQAQQQGIPVYGIIFEGVNVPAELKLEATVDIRTNLHEKIDLIDATIQGNAAPQDAVPPPYRWNIPDKIPRAVAISILEFGSICLFYLLIIIFSVYELVYTIPAITGVGLFSNLSAVMAAFPSFSDADYGLLIAYHAGIIFNLTYILMMIVPRFVIPNIMGRASEVGRSDHIGSLITGLIFGFIFLLVVITQPVSVVGTGIAIATVIVGIVMFVSIGMAMTTIRADELFIRIPRVGGKSVKPSDWRVELRKKYGIQTTHITPDDALSRRMTTVDDTVDFYVHHAPDDEPMATYITDLLMEEGHESVMPDTAEHHLLLISDRTTLDQIDRWLYYRDAGITPVIATQVNVSELPDAIQSSQWLHLTQKELSIFKTKFAYLVHNPSDWQNLIPEVPESAYTYAFRHVSFWRDLTLADDAMRHTGLWSSVIFAHTALLIWQFTGGLSLSTITLSQMLIIILYLLVLIIAALNISGIRRIEKRQYTLRQILLYFDLPFALIAMTMIVFDVPYNLLWMLAVQLGLSLIINVWLIPYVYPRTFRKYRDRTSLSTWEADEPSQTYRYLITIILYVAVSFLAYLPYLGTPMIVGGLIGLLLIGFLGMLQRRQKTIDGTQIGTQS